MVQALLKVVRDAGMADRVAIQSFDWRTLRVVQRLAPSIPTVCLTLQTANNDTVRDGRWTAGLQIADHASVPALVKAAGCATWSPNGGAVTQALVKEAHALGLQVIPWTINAPADMDRLVGWGVDGLITDYPDRLRQVLAGRGMVWCRSCRSAGSHSQFSAGCRPAKAGTQGFAEPSRARRLPMPMSVGTADASNRLRCT